MTTTLLPRMPACKFKDMQCQRRYIGDVYTRDQMQAYATQARADLEAENKRLRELLEGVLKIGRGTSGRIIIEGWQEEVIRAALEKQP